MKALILTYAVVSDIEKQVLQETNIYKLAINQHAEELCPNARIITDYILQDIRHRFSQIIISVRDRLNVDDSRIKYFDGEFKGATILSAIDYLIYKNYDEILIVGDNNVNHKQFQNLVKFEINTMKVNAKIYQYTEGNFNLPVKSIIEFCS